MYPVYRLRSIPSAGTIFSINWLAQVSYRSCTVVAQRFSFFHGISRSPRHLFYVAIPLRDHVSGRAEERKATGRGRKRTKARLRRSHVRGECRDFERGTESAWTIFAPGQQSWVGGSHWT